MQTAGVVTLRLTQFLHGYVGSVARPTLKRRKSTPSKNSWAVWSKNLGPWRQLLKNLIFFRQKRSSSNKVSPITSWFDFEAPARSHRFLSGICCGKINLACTVNYNPGVSFVNGSGVPNSGCLKKSCVIRIRRVIRGFGRGSAKS